MCPPATCRRARAPRLPHIAKASVQPATDAAVGVAQGVDNRRLAPQRTYVSTNFSDANFPVDDQGRTYHLGTKRGEVSNRVLSVGSAKRARLLAEFLEPCQEGEQLFVLESSRGFITITGLYKGVPVSIICTHMGMPNMDFVVRETKAVVDGQLAMVRLGTCGGLQQHTPLGTVVLAFPGSICIRRDPDAFTINQQHLQASSPANGSGHGNGKPAAAAQVVDAQPGGMNGNGSHANGNGAGVGTPLGSGAVAAAGAAACGGGGGDGAVQGLVPYYRLSLPVPGDEELTGLLERELHFLLGEQNVARGLNASADSFYSSQGRLGTEFSDCNSELLDDLVQRYPECLTLEMETFHLLDLARCSGGQVVGAAAAIVLAQRQTNEFLDSHRLYLLERAAGAAALNALIKRPLQVERCPGVEYLWD